MQQTIIEKQMEEAAGRAGGLLRSRFGIWALAVISFFESALPVPLLTDPFLVAYILADKSAMVRGVIVTTIFSVLGGVFAYVLALSFYEFIVTQYLVGATGEQFYAIVEEFKKETFVMTFLGALTPIPYTLVALAAGFVQGNILLFIVASTIGRGLRYAIVGALTYKFGERALAMARKQILLLSLACFILVAVYIFLHL